MASKASLENGVRNEFISHLVKMIETDYETDALIVDTGTYAIPVLDAEQNEKWIVVKVSIPRGTRNGEGGYDPYDGYAAHEEYQIAQESKVQERAVKKAMREAEKGKKKED